MQNIKKLYFHHWLLHPLAIKRERGKQIKRQKEKKKVGMEREGGNQVGNPGIAPKAGMLPLPRKSNIQKLPNSMRQKQAHDKSAFMLLPNLAKTFIKCKVRPRGQTEKQMWSRVMQPKLHVSPKITTMNRGRDIKPAPEEGISVFSPHRLLYTLKNQFFLLPWYYFITGVCAQL